MEQNGSGNFWQRLLIFHQVEIDVCFQIKQFEHLIQHLTVLCSETQERLDIFSSFQFLNHWRHLYCLRSCPDDCHDFYLTILHTGFLF